MSSTKTSLSNNQPNSVVFLDIDGVLITDSSCATANANLIAETHPHCVLGPYVFDPECVVAVNQLLETSQAKLVIASDWRGNENFPHVLRQIGIKAPLHKD